MGDNDRVDAMVSVRLAEARDRELDRIADCAQNLREWPMANQPPDSFATIDRRAISCVWGGPAWCWVHVSGGPPVMLGAPYDELVAWWRGGR